MDGMKAKLKKESDGDYILILNNPKEYPFPLPLLSTKNCQAIERGYDLDELIDIELKKLPYTKHLDDGQYNDGQLYGFELGAYWGFQKALELMSDKKFSEFLDREKELGISDIKTIERIQWYYNTYFDKSQQTEWEVEIEMWFHGTRHKKGEWIPKLDADGCLILKLKSE